MKSLEHLKNEILAYGFIDNKEVNELRDFLNTDGKIDLEEAEFLFEIINTVSGNNSDSSWELFFIETITRYLLEDENSPSVIDGDEANWLYEKIKGDEQIDSIERNLLLNIKTKAKSFPSKLESFLS